MIVITIITLLFLVDIRAEYPGKSTDIYSSTPSSKNVSVTGNCCPCKRTTVKPITTTSTPIEVPEPQSFRLPDFIRPHHYKLSIRIDFEAFKHLSRGKAYTNLTISISVQNSTNVIYLNHGENLMLNSVIVKNANGNQNEQNLTESLFLSNLGILHIYLKSNLTVGSEYLIEISDFESLHSDNQEGGILMRKYQNLDGEWENMLATQFQPEYARLLFPCFDEPQFKASFQLNITTNSDYTILSNMPEIICKNDSDFNRTIWKTCIFQETPVMSVYNLVFAIVNFSSIEQTDDKGRKFRMWARESQIHKTRFALETTIKVLRILEDKLQIEFPLKKIDSLAIPNLNSFLGMEHYGLITYDEPVVVWTENVSLSFSKYLCVVIICHEVSHQWFGNLVTMSWWQDLWLNEGFATFFSHKITKEVFSNDLYFSLEMISTMNYVRNFDDNFSVMVSAISDPVGPYVETKFDYLSYKKGFIVVHLMEEMLGSKSFDLSLIDYLKNNKYKPVGPEDLFRSLDKLSNMSISNVIHDWLHNPCYPIVSVRINGKSSIHINQSVSLKYKLTKFKSKLNYSTSSNWRIPLYIMYGNNTYQNREKIRIFNKSFDILKLDQFNISNHWLIINVNYGSFFTTDFDQLMFNRLKTQLLLNHTVIPPMNRAQIMEDFYEISKKTQKNNLVDLLTLFTYLRNETDPVPMVTAVNLLDKLNGLLEFRSFYPTWVKYVTFVLQPSLDKLVSEFQNDFRDSNSTYFTLRRSFLKLACKLRLPHCTKITDKIIRRWQKDKLLKSDYDLLHIALCKYVEMDNNGDYWQSIYASKKFNTWDYISVKYYAMGCSKIPWIIEKNIDITFNILKATNNRIDFPHVSEIATDHVPADYLLGTSSLSNILTISLIYNTPNSYHFFNRFNKDGLNTIYTLIQHPAHFVSPVPVIEYAVPTLSHYNFIIYLSSQKEKSRNVILIEAKTNLNWILINRDLDKQLLSLIM